MKRGLVLLAAAVLAAATHTAAQQNGIGRLDGSSIKPAKIDETATRLMKAAEVTGLGLAVLDRGKIAYLRAYGVRDKEAGSPLTVDSVMSGASFSKAAFAYTVMQLVDGGSLDLDKPVYLYLPKPLPDYPDYSDLAGDPRYKQITARMLLSHTAGLPNWRQLDEGGKLRIHFRPGSRYAYSGEGIVLLQLVVEAVTKEPLEALMQERLFRPLGMTRTSMVWQERFESDYANGYDEYGRSLGPQKRSHADAAGSMLTTTSDFARFVQAAMLGKGLRKARAEMLSPQIQILSKRQFPSLATETTDENKAIRLSYGLGWGLYWTPYGRAFFKEGHDDGWRNYTVCFDEKGMGIVLMTNSANGEGIFEELLETVLANPFTPVEWEGYTPYDRLPPRPPLKVHKEAAVDPKLFDGYVGRYEVAPNFVVAVTREGDHLFAQGTGLPKAELFPESERDFFFKAVEIQVTFEVDAQGRATSMITHQAGADFPGKRID
jgi:CubicO group peptidase (beta-lactamase class C family)